MDYGRPELADRLAAEYVLGTLRHGARRRFESLLPAHPRLRLATQAWQSWLMPLTAALVPVQPSGEVWRRISERIGASPGADRVGAGPAGFWRGLALWRGIAGFASVAALGLALLLANPAAQPPPVVVVLTATSAAGAVQPASLVASISGDRTTLVARPIVQVSVQADRSLELWAVPTSGTPRSLGLLPGGSGTVALRGSVLVGADTLAVTLEPAGGSPTGKPTGPILYAGKFSL
ncbi:MAG: anti-sigma factor [Pseudomonadota bacterium]|nr:anti-sigma factor [Pseudomonadota bacterium]